MKKLLLICLLLLSVMSLSAAKLHRIEDKGKYGYADEAGNIVIKCEYDLAMDFSQGVAYVCNKDRVFGFEIIRHCFINEAGNVVMSISSDAKGVLSVIDPANYKGDEIMFKDGFAKIPGWEPRYISLYQGFIEATRPKEGALGNGGLEMLFQSNISDGIVFDKKANYQVAGFKEIVERGDVLIGVSTTGGELAFDKESHFPYSSYYYTDVIERNRMYHSLDGEPSAIGAPNGIWTGDFGIVYALNDLFSKTPSPYLYTKFGEMHSYLDSLNVLKFDNGDLMFVTYVQASGNCRLLDKSCATVARGQDEITNYLADKSYKLVEYKNLTSGPIVDCIKSAPVERVTDPSNQYIRHQTGSVWRKKDISNMVFTPESFSSKPLRLQIVNGFNGQRSYSEPVTFKPKKDNISDIIISGDAIYVLNKKGKECKMEDFEITSSSDKVEIEGNDIKLNVSPIDVITGKVEKEYDVTVKHIASGMQTTIKIAPMFVDSIQDNKHVIQTYVFTEIPGETGTDYAICYDIDTKEYQVVKMPFKINGNGMDGKRGRSDGYVNYPGKDGAHGANIVVYMSKYFKEHFGEQSLKIENDGGKGGEGAGYGSSKADNGFDGKKGCIEFITLE